MDRDNLFKTTSIRPISILDASIPLAKYHPIDLSSSNSALNTLDITNPEDCQLYIDATLVKSGGMVAYGGYLEKRNLYANASRFSEGESRNIHLGVDFWCEQGTKVLVPVEGVVHSFQNNDDIGNYGPTIILEHKTIDSTYYSLYGHLSIESLDNIYIGKRFKAGDELALLGSPAINVNYAPHLHFQLILNLQGYIGDYPGVCSQMDLAFYKNNCPDPNLLLGLY